jgi:CheY-like chemotaxis protein
LLKIPAYVHVDSINEADSLRSGRNMDANDIEMGPTRADTKYTTITATSDSASCSFKPSAEDDISDVDLSQLTVLIVDDVSSTRKIMARMLKEKVAKTIQAQDGQECVDMITQESDVIDIILLDFEMPLLNGPDAAKQLRKLGLTVPIIGITGNVLPEDRQHFLDSGVNVVISKPLNPDKLEVCMKELWLKSCQIVVKVGSSCPLAFLR